MDYYFFSLPEGFRLLTDGHPSTPSWCFVKPVSSSRLPARNPPCTHLPAAVSENTNNTIPIKTLISMAEMYQSGRQIYAMSCLELRGCKATVTGTGNAKSLLSPPERYIL